VAWWTLRPALTQVEHLAGASTSSSLVALGVLAEKVGLRLAVAALTWGAVDYLWRRNQRRKTLRMSRDEVRREHKEREGDPVLRAERQRLHREFLQNHRIDEVRSAKLVVTDSGLRAVALAYVADATGPPLVIAKGERLLARKIIEMAREGGVLVAEDAVLVQGLVDVEEGNEIPEALYQPVAEWLTQSEKSPNTRSS
jgi:flagellar biosynthesis protein FlhB